MIHPENMASLTVAMLTLKKCSNGSGPWILLRVCSKKQKLMRKYELLGHLNVRTVKKEKTTNLHRTA